jgi:hypothetical protein
MPCRPHRWQWDICATHTPLDRDEAKSVKEIAERERVAERTIIAFSYTASEARASTMPAGSEQTTRFKVGSVAPKRATVPVVGTNLPANPLRTAQERPEQSPRS